MTANQFPGGTTQPIPANPGPSSDDEFSLLQKIAQLLYNLSVAGGGAAVNALVALLPTGSRLTGYWTTAPTGTVLANGDTIGNASSGSTRANADTEALFSLLWTMWGVLVTDGFIAVGSTIKTSAGANSTFGASAAADYAANKRIVLPDERTRVAAMSGGTALTILAGNQIGRFAGEDRHTLDVTEIPTHDHGYNEPGAGFDAQSGSDANVARLGAGGVTTTSGGSGAHNNVQPTILCAVAIKL